MAEEKRDCVEAVHLLYHYLDGERMKASASFVQGEWRYEELVGPSHWIPLDAPDRVNELLDDWLR